MSRLTDMTDAKIIPQIIESTSKQWEVEKDKIICKKLFDLNIDKDILQNQLFEINRLNRVIKKYEDLEEQEKLLELPCKIGDTLFWLKDRTIDRIIIEVEVVSYLIQKRETSIFARDCEGLACEIVFELHDIGKTIFLTREKAELALKRMESAE